MPNCQYCNKETKRKTTCKSCTNKRRIYTEETKQKISQSRLGEKNGRWKGDEVTYGALHDWIKAHLKKPKQCNNCKEVKPLLDLANISGEYKRDILDWEWLCRRCHMIKDGRLDKFLSSTRNKKI